MYQIRLMLPNAACNLRCKYCLNTNNIRGLDVEIDFDKLFEKMDLMTFKSISIWGGEPLYNPNLEKILYALREHYPDNVEICITSNGVLLNDKFVELFNKLKVSYAISHDGYAQYLRCKDFLKEPEYIERLKKLERFAGFNGVISRYNIDLCKNYQYFIDACKDISGNWQISFGLFELFEEEILDFMPSAKQAAELKRNYKAIQKLANEGAPHLESYATRKRHRKVIPKIWRCRSDSRLTLDTQGNVYQCQVAADRRDSRIPQPHIPLMCVNCIHADYCRGICPLISNRFRKKLCLCHHLYYDALLELYDEDKIKEEHSK